MKIGYPCVNAAMDCSSGMIFRLASYSGERVAIVVAATLTCLRRILEWKVTYGLLFFRIGSSIAPFDSHPVNIFPWQTYFKADFRAIGDYIRVNDLWVSFHPDQFVVLNSPSPDIMQPSIQELMYQGSMLDLMGLDGTAKLQIHVGGLYSDRELAISRFAQVYVTLPAAVQARVMVEKDDRLFPLRDCLELHQLTGVPILFDNFHHECLNHGEPMAEVLRLAASTWHPVADGVPMMDYSSQALGGRKGKHTNDLVDDLFSTFLDNLHGLGSDIMLEIKNKATTALRAVVQLRARGLSSAVPNLPSPPLTLLGATKANGMNSIAANCLLSSEPLAFSH